MADRLLCRTVCVPAAARRGRPASGIATGMRYAVVAWVVPNTQAATRKQLDQYLVTVEELEQRTGERFPEVTEFARYDKPEASWLVPIGCDRS